MASGRQNFSYHAGMQFNPIKQPTLRAIQYVPVVLLCLGSVGLVGLQNRPIGLGILAAGLISLALLPRIFARNLALLYGAVALLGFTPINTDIGNTHLLLMGVPLILTVAVPYIISRYGYGDYLVRFPFHHGRRWFRSELAYILVSAVVAYLFLPFYFAQTGAYLNWTVEPGFNNLARLFVGTNVLAIWDELFFVSVCLGVLRVFMPFRWANIAQAVLWTSFLYELGFKSWGIVMVFLLALLQGYIFNRTDSLLYVITIHLVIDLFLFLALIHAYHPDWMPIFVN